MKIKKKNQKEATDLPDDLDEFLAQSDSDSDSENNPLTNYHDKKHKIDLSVRRQDIQKRIEELREKRRTASALHTNHEPVKTRQASAPASTHPTPNAWLKPKTTPVPVSVAFPIEQLIVPTPSVYPPSESPIVHTEREEREKPRENENTENPSTRVHGKPNPHIKDTVTSEYNVSSVPDIQIKSLTEQSELEELQVSLDLDTTEQDKQKFFDGMAGNTGLDGTPLDFAQLNAQFASDEDEDILQILAKPTDEFLAGLNPVQDPTEHAIDAYSLSFDSVTDLEDVSMLKDVSAEITLPPNFDFLNNEAPLSQIGLDYKLPPKADLDPLPVFISSNSLVPPVNPTIESEQDQNVVSAQVPVPDENDDVSFSTVIKDAIQEPLPVEEPVHEESPTVEASNTVSLVTAKEPGTNVQQVESTPEPILPASPHIAHIEEELNQVEEVPTRSLLTTPTPNYKDSFPSESSDNSEPVITQFTKEITLSQPAEQIPTTKSADPVEPSRFQTSNYMTFEDFLVMNNDEAVPKSNTPKKKSRSRSASPVKPSSSKSKVDVLKKTNEKLVQKSKREPSHLKAKKKEVALPVIVPTVSLSRKASFTGDSLVKVVAVASTGPSAYIAAQELSQKAPSDEPKRDPIADILVMENSDLKKTIDVLNAQVGKLVSELAEKTDDLTNAQEQIRFFEKQLDDEREQNRAVSQKLHQGQPLSKGEETVLRKEMEEQELLIRGFQTENEKLVSQIKAVRNQLKENDQKHFLKQEALLRDLASQKAHLLEESLVANDGMSHAKYSVRVESLETELSNLKHSSITKEADFKAKIVELEARLHEALINLEILSAADPERLKQLESDKKLLKDKYDSYIIELEGKLEVLLDQQGLSFDYKTAMEKQSQMVRDIEAVYKVLESLVNTPPGSTTSLYKVPDKKRASTGTRKLKDLETQISTLKEAQMKSDFMHSAHVSEIMVKTTRPHIDENDYIRHLKHRVKKLEAEVLKLSNEKEREIKNAQEEAKLLQRESEQHIESLRTSLHATSMNDIHAVKSQLELQSQEEIKTLKEEMNGLRKKNAELTASSSEALPFELNSVKQDKTRIMKRNLELEKLVDDYHSRMRALAKDKQVMESDFTSQLAQKNALVQKYESRIVELQKDVHDKIFALDEAKHLELIHSLKLELDDVRHQLSQTSIKLEISEGTRQAVHESTITILKQAQEESAQLALAHHEKALQLLRNELVQGDPRQGSKSSYSERLEKRIEELEEMNLTYQLQLRDKRDLDKRLIELEQESSRLKKENSQYQASLELSKVGWPPALHHFEGLMTKIYSLEEVEEKRTLQIKEMMSEPSAWIQKEVKKERDRWVKILRSKDEEILAFQKELDALLRSIQKLKALKSAQDDQATFREII